LRRARPRRALRSTEAGALSWAERPQRQAQALAKADADFLVDEVPLAATQAAEGIQRVVTIVQAMRAFGKITVRTWAECASVVIEVADTGAGIPPEIAHRVFEPFFTTKEVGAGTGQGLSLAHGLVHKRHGGTISFVSEPGLGTTFTIGLPVEEAKAIPE